MEIDRTDDKSPAHEAADWFVRLQSDHAGEADWLAYDTWLAASPENWAAYDKLERLSVEIEARANDVRAALRTGSPRVLVRRAWATWATAGAVAAAAGFALWTLVPMAGAPQTFDAAKGQVREIALADGTQVTLDTGSHIEVRLERRARRVTMGEGEAAFDVAKDASRPFLITVGDRTVKVVGTEFNVENRDHRLSVIVSRGVVEVAPVQGGGDQAVRLVRGNRLQHQIGSTAQRIDIVARPEDAFSWRKLRLIYDNAPLADVVNDLNRYFPRQVLLDNEAKGLKFSGVLVVADEDAVLRRLGELLPVAADHSADTVLLRYRKGAD